MQDSKVTITITAVDGATKVFTAVGDAAVKQAQRAAAAWQVLNKVQDVSIKSGTSADKLAQSTNGVTEATKQNSVAQGESSNVTEKASNSTKKAADSQKTLETATRRSYLAQIAFTTVLSAGINKAFMELVDVAGQAIQRTDLIAQFPSIIQSLGGAATDASAALSKLSDYIGQIGGNLQEASTSVVRFTEITKDVKAATAEFVGVNNALIAGGAGAEVQKNALEQLTQSYSRGVPQLIEWKSIMIAMPAQLSMVATALNLPNAQTLGEALTAKKVTMQQFMTELTKLSTGTGPIANQMLVRMNSMQFAWNRFKNTMVQGMTQIIQTIGRQNIINFFDLLIGVIRQLSVYAIGLVSVLFTVFNTLSSLFGGPQIKLAADNTGTLADNLGAGANNANDLADGLDAATNAASGLAAFDKMNALATPSAGKAADNGAGTGAGGLSVGDAAALNSIFDSLQGKLVDVGATAKVIAGIIAAFFAYKAGTALLDSFLGLKTVLNDIAGLSAFGKIKTALKDIAVGMGIINGESAVSDLGGLGKAEKDAKAVGTLSKEVTGLRDSMKGLIALTVLNDLENAIGNKQYLEIFLLKIGDAFKKLGTGIATGAKNIYNGVAKVGETALSLGSNVKGAVTDMAATVSAKGPMTAMSDGIVVSLGAALRGVSSLVMAIPGIGWVVLAVTAVVAAFVKYWDQINESLKSVGTQFQNLQGLFIGTGNAVSGLSGLFDWLFNLFADIGYPIIEAIIAIFDILVGSIKVVIKFISALFSGLGDLPVLKQFGDMIGVIGLGFKGLGELIKASIPHITDFFNKITNTGPEQAYKTAVDNLTTASKKHGDALKAEKDAIDGVRSAQLALKNSVVAVDNDRIAVGELVDTLAALTPGTDDYTRASHKLDAAQAQLAVDQKSVADETDGVAVATKAQTDAQKAVTKTSADLLTAYDNMIAKNGALSKSARETADKAGKSFIDSISTSILNGSTVVSDAAKQIMTDMTSVIANNDTRVQAEATGLMTTMTAALSSQDPNVILAAQKTMDIYVAEVKANQPIVATKTQELATALSTNLASQDPVVRQRAIDTMTIYDGAMQSKNTDLMVTSANLVSILGQQLKSSNPDVVAKAQETMASIISGMNSKDQDVKDKAIATYNKLKDQFVPSDMYNKGQALISNLGSGSFDYASQNWVMGPTGQALGRNLSSGVAQTFNVILKASSSGSGFLNQSDLGNAKIIAVSQFAAGGLVMKPTMMGNNLLGENGIEAIVPLENNLEWIDKLAAKINSAGGNGQPIQLTVQIGEDKIATKIIDLINEKTQMSGRNAILV